MDLHFDPSVWIAAYGYWAVFVLIGLESMGVPLPGETVLVAAAIYAGTTHELNIFGVVAAAATGAVVGDNIGYEIGRDFAGAFDEELRRRAIILVLSVMVPTGRSSCESL